MTTSASDGAALILSSGHRALPVQSDTGQFIGILNTQIISDVLASDDDSDALTVGDVCERPDTADPDATLEAALDAILAAGGSDGVPVVDSNGILHGWLPQEAILKALAAER